MMNITMVTTLIPPGPHSYTDPDMAFFMTSTVVAITIISVFYSIKARQKLRGAEKDLFNKMLDSILLFALGVMFHGMREIIWGNSLLRIPEHTLYLLSFIFAIEAGLYVMNNKEEWGIGGT